MACILFFFSDKPNGAMYKQICWKIIQEEKKYLVHMEYAGSGSKGCINAREKSMDNKH